MNPQHANHTNDKKEEKNKTIEKYIDFSKNVDRIKETVMGLIVQEGEKKIHSESIKRLDWAIKKGTDKIQKDIIDATKKLYN